MKESNFILSNNNFIDYHVMWQSIYFHILEFNSNYEINLFQLEKILFLEDLSLILRLVSLNLFSPFCLNHFFFVVATIISDLGKFLFTQIISKPFFFYLIRNYFYDQFIILIKYYNFLRMNFNYLQAIRIIANVFF